MVSRELEKECIVVFDEAHNIDNVCIEVGCSCIYTCVESITVGKCWFALIVGSLPRRTEP